MSNKPCQGLFWLTCHIVTTQSKRTLCDFADSEILVWPVPVEDKSLPSYAEVWPLVSDGWPGDWDTYPRGSVTVRGNWAVVMLDSELEDYNSYHGCYWKEDTLEQRIRHLFRIPDDMLVIFSERNEVGGKA